MAEQLDPGAMIREVLARMKESQPVDVTGSIGEQRQERTEGAAGVRGRGLEEFSGLDLDTILNSQAGRQRGINENEIREMLQQQVLEEELRAKAEKDKLLREIGIDEQPVGAQDPFAR